MLTFFCSLSPKASVRLGMAEGGEGRDAWAHSGDRGKIIFVRWDASLFDCLAKYSSKQLRSHLPSLSWQHQGLWRQKLPWRLGGTAITPADHSMFTRRKDFQIILEGGRGKKKNAANCFWLRTISRLDVKKGLLRSLANILFNH